MKRIKLLSLIVVFAVLFVGLGTISSQAQVTFEHYKTIKGHSRGFATALSFSPSGRYLASAVSGDKLIMWDVNTGQKVQEGQLESGEYNISIEWKKKDGNEIAECYAHEINAALLVLEVMVGAVEQSPDGKYAARGSEDGTIDIKLLSNNQTIQTLQGHSERVEAVRFSEDGKYLASGSADGTIIIWKQKEVNSYQNSENDYSSHSIPEIYSIEIANVKVNGELITDYGKPIYFYETMYLSPKIRYKSNENGKYRFDILVRDSSGRRIKGLPDPYLFTYYSDVNLNYGEGVVILNGWGNNDKGSFWKAGDYYIEIWYRSCKLKTLKFTIY